MIRDINANDFLFILAALRWTVLLSVLACLFGVPLGLVVAVGRLSGHFALRWATAGYIQFLQGTPLLMQLFLVFFGANLMGWRIDPWPAAIVAFTLYTGAFLGDIWRGCIEAIPHGQWEAARSLALPWAVTLYRVILPQAARIATPPTVGFLVQVIKGTSLTAIIGLTELVRAGQMINNATFQPLAVYGAVAGLYFAVCWPLSRYSQRLERRLGRGFQGSALL